jgi:C-terminal peptidase prc
VILVGILSVVLGVVCTGCAGEPNVQEEVTGGAPGNIVAQVAMTTEALLGLGSSFPALGVAKKSPKKDEKKDEDEEEEEGKDYWKGVEFTRENFEEVQNFVRVNYIDPGTSEDRAFGEACNYALLGLNQPHTLLPTQFYKARKGHKDEEGALDGKAKRFGKRNKLTLLRLKDLSEEEEEEEEPRKRLTDDEIREARENYKTRQTLLEKTWKSISFTSADLETCIALGMKLGKKDKEQNHEELNRDLWLWSSQGFLRSLDPHSAVVSAKAWEESTQKTTDSSFDGIGAILTQRDGQTMIENPIEGQPAYGAGLRSGDVIVKVDGKSIKGQPLGKVVQQIRGPKNTEVVLTVRREGEPSDLQIPIVRAYIEIQNVQSRMVKDHPGIGYVKLSGFVPTSAARLRKAVEALSSQTLRGSLRGLILDLRSNSGGLLQQAVEIGDMFVKEGDIVSVRDRLRGGRGDKVYEAHSKGTYDIPLVVLVNDSSASASEIVAGAVQDNMRGLIVGERTFGKASVQTLFNSHLGPKDYYIKLTVARYYAPSGRTIQVVGIQPDLEVVPVIDKPMPLGFREENLGKHLAAIETEYQSSNVELIKPLEACVKKRGKAEKMHSADPNPQIRFDYQLMKGADYLECLADTPVPKQSL